MLIHRVNVRFKDAVTPAPVAALDAAIASLATQFLTKT